MLRYGISTRAKYRADPPLHIVQALFGSRLLTWCGGTPALEERTVTARRCRQCQALARENLREDGAENQSSAYDWFLERKEVSV